MLTNWKYLYPPLTFFQLDVDLKALQSKWRFKAEKLSVKLQAPVIQRQLPLYCVDSLKMLSLHPLFHHHDQLCMHKSKFTTVYLNCAWRITLVPEDCPDVCSVWIHSFIRKVWGLNVICEWRHSQCFLKGLFSSDPPCDLDLPTGFADEGKS